MKFRMKKDTMGEVQVPADKYWGHKQNDLEIILKLVHRPCLMK
jgi:fumarate hydratase class II